MSLLEWLEPEHALALKQIDRERRNWLDRKPFAEAKRLFAALPERDPARLVWDRDEVIVGEDLAADDPVRRQTSAAARAMMPWKKGPFRLFGEVIDAEWRSQAKWDRLAPDLPDQRGKRILDVGCNNGYYLFRLLAQEPDFLLGIDPVPRLWYQFHLLQHFARRPQLHFRMWGWEETRLMPGVFDTIFCMGIVYHHTDPIRILRSMREALRPGGLLVLESIVLDGAGSHCLFPADRYARMRNVWFVPTLEALTHFLARARFRQIRTIAVNRHTPQEQRTTAWNPGPSYAAFLDPDDPDRTVEGYPAPHRAIVFAEKAS